jgi:hypothetical protein
MGHLQEKSLVKNDAGNELIVRSARFDAARSRKVPEIAKSRVLLDVFKARDYAGVMPIRTISCRFLLAILSVASTSRAETFTHITAENGIVEYDIQKDPGSGVYTEPSSTYKSKLTYKQGQRNTNEPVLVATLKPTTAEHFRGASALELEIAARDEVDTVKAAYKVSIDSVGGHDKFTPRVADAKDWYHGYAMKIDPTDFSLPSTGELMLEQWWQGTPFHPPVALVIVRPQDAKEHGWKDIGKSGNFALMLRDDEHNALNTTPGEPRYFDLGPVVLNDWLRWTIHVRPSPTEDKGAVTVWLNDQEKFKLENIKLGYDPDNPQYADHKPSNRLASVNVCLYRMNGQNHQRVWFDEIKFADRQADAAP